MKSIFSILFFLFQLHFLRAEKAGAAKFIGTFYINTPFALLHELPNDFSAGIDTLNCNQSVKVFERGDLPSENFWEVEAAGKKGLVKKEFLSPKRAECAQERYAKFFDSLGLELEDRYYWGRLYDQMRIGRSKAK